MKRSEIIRAIRERATNELDWVVFTDLEKGQIKRATQEYPMPMPALLVQIRSTSFKSTAGGCQIGDMRIVLSLYQDYTTDSFTGAESETDTDTIIDRSDDVWKAMHGVRTGSWGHLVRLSEPDPEYGMRYMCTRQEYKVSVKDLMPAGTEIKDSPTVTIITEQL